MAGRDYNWEQGMDLQARNRDHSGPFIIRNEGVTNGLLILAGTTEPSHLSYEIHYIA